MTVEVSRERARAACLARPGAVEGFPFGEQTVVVTVGGKMFALLGLDDEPGRLTVKCEPGYAAALVAEHEAVVPGYHMDKRHWITVTLDGSLPVELVDELVTDSHDLVVAGLPKRLRPT